LLAMHQGSEELLVARAGADGKLVESHRVVPGSAWHALASSGDTFLLVGRWVDKFVREPGKVQALELASDGVLHPEQIAFIDDLPVAAEDSLALTSDASGYALAAMEEVRRGGAQSGDEAIRHVLLDHHGRTRVAPQPTVFEQALKESPAVAFNG